MVNKPDQQQRVSFTDGDGAGISDNPVGLQPTVLFANNHLAGWTRPE